ncbi:MAG: OmpA family protein [Kangiellaceae bacterium]|jgi:outer membrane protein OmpA-like peptidoglycan-associated protein|nr:OmpA family protein [Kangiellaceae bacterium]
MNDMAKRVGYFLLSSGATLSLLVASPMVAADFRSYEAELDQSSWQYAGNPVRCELSHDIPRFGAAQFFAKASRTPNMAFVLDGIRNRVTTDKPISVRALAPTWQSHQRSKMIGVVPAVPGEKTLNVINETAWRMLSSLEQGMSPTFFYRDFADNSDQVSVALSAVNFSKVYDEFLQCVENLLPYDFREIQYTMINFNFNGSALSAKDKSKLDVLAEFIKYDPDIEVVLVEGHTDSIALRRYNKALGMRRAQSVANYLTDKGVDNAKLTTVSHGERRPLESNATREGQAMNRRVFITLSKSS